MIRLALLSVAFLFAYTDALSQVSDAELKEQLQRFELWTDCEPLYLVVEDLRPDAAEIGLRREDIVTLVRSRLRAARIYKDYITGTYLYLNVSVVGQGYNIRLQFKKRVTDDYTGFRGSATTWDGGGTGTHGGDASHIKQWISEWTDKFIDEYLGVNSDSCK